MLFKRKSHHTILGFTHQLDWSRKVALAKEANLSSFWWTLEAFMIIGMTISRSFLVIACIATIISITIIIL